MVLSFLFFFFFFSSHASTCDGSGAVFARAFSCDGSGVGGLRRIHAVGEGVEVPMETTVQVAIHTSIVVTASEVEIEHPATNRSSCLRSTCVHRQCSRASTSQY